MNNRNPFNHQVFKNHDEGNRIEKMLSGEWSGFKINNLIKIKQNFIIKMR